MGDIKNTLFILFLWLYVSSFSMAGENSLSKQNLWAGEGNSWEEESLVDLWEKGVLPIAPQKYDGHKGLPQRVFFSGKKKKKNFSGLRFRSFGGRGKKMSGVPLGKAPKNSLKEQRKKKKRVLQKSRRIKGLSKKNISIKSKRRRSPASSSKKLKK